VANIYHSFVKGASLSETVSQKNAIHLHTVVSLNLFSMLGKKVH